MTECILNLLGFYSVFLADTKNISGTAAYLLNFPVKRRIPAAYFPGRRLDRERF